MKNNFFTLAKHTAVTTALLVLMVAPFAPLTAQAQVAFPTTDVPAIENLNNPLTPTGDTGTGPTSAGTISSFQNPTSAAGAPAAAAAAATQAQQRGSSIPSECDWFSNWSLCITNVVYVFTVGIGSGFAYVAAYFFDWAIALSLNGSAYALDFVSQGWTTARDLANMAFLFILIYIAFIIMFEADTTGTVHMLTTVIIVALLVNFSFFFTRLAIDAGNILSIQFYNAIDAPPLSSTAGQVGVQGQVLSGLSAVGGVAGANVAGQTKDLTAGIMGMLNLQGLFSTDSFNKWYNGDPANKVPPATFMVALVSLSFLYIAAGIMFWILTVAFVTNGAKFLMRIVVLWFLIIASPLAFVARAVPIFEQYYHRWQEELISHSFYPVAFMFIFLILTKFATQMSCTTLTTCSQTSLIGGMFSGLQGANAASPVASIGYAVANVGIRMGFVIAMLYIGMEASKKIGVMGASAAEHAGNWVGGKFIGTTGWAARNTVGYAGNRLASTPALRNMEAKAGLTGLFGRGLRGTLGAVGRASFDARGAPMVGKELAKDFGKAQKGGYAKELEERTKTKEKKLKAVEPSEGQKMQALDKAKEEHNYQTVKSTEEDTRKKSQDRLEIINSELEKLRTKDRKDPGDDERAKDLVVSKRVHESKIKISNRNLEALESVTKKRAEEISGEGESKVYATTLATRNIRNLGIPFTSSIEAAAKIRKGKSDVEKIADAVKEAAKEDKEGDESKKDTH
jgi:hypothetical protein